MPNMKNQITEVFKESGVIQTGQSKHDTHNQLRSEGYIDAHAIARETGYFSNGSATNGLNAWQQMGKFMESEFGVRNLDKITPARLETFLTHKATEIQTAKGFDNICNHIQKYVSAYNTFAETRGINHRISESKIDGMVTRLKSDLGSALGTAGSRDRAYDSPELIRNAISDEKHQLGLKLSEETGARRNEFCLIKEEQLSTKNGIPTIEIRGKGGKCYELYPSRETFDRLKAFIDRDGVFKISYTSLYNDLKQACSTVGEYYQGIHGFRYCFAQKLYSDLRDSGLIHEVAAKMVAEKMGHGRYTITQVYTGKGGKSS